MTAALPPGPRWPAIVQTVAMLRSTPEFIERMSRRYGDLFTVRTLVFGTQIFTSDPELIKQIMASEGDALHGGEANAPVFEGDLVRCRPTLQIHYGRRRKVERVELPRGALFVPTALVGLVIPMPTRKPSSRGAPRVLPEQLPQPEVLLGCFYHWVAVAITDRPAEVEALLRASLPERLPAPKQRAAAKPMVPNVGIVRWSEAQQCLWFQQSKGGAWRVHPERLTAEQRAKVVAVEPRGAIGEGHSASRSPTEPVP